MRQGPPARLWSAVLEPLVTATNDVGALFGKETEPGLGGHIAGWGHRHSCQGWGQAGVCPPHLPAVDTLCRRQEVAQLWEKMFAPTLLSSPR